MTTDIGFFQAKFGIQDQASATLARIRENTQKLNQTALQSQSSLGAMGREIQAAGRKFKALDEEAGKKIVRLGTRLQGLTNSSRVTGSALADLSRQAAILGQIGGKTGAQLNRVSASLVGMTANMKMGEKQIMQTANRMSFMGDVSAQAAMKMRAVSASAQGLMLSMSLLEGNIIGIAFSLIFMQFSGMLKLSLAMAAVGLVAGGVFMVLKKVFGERKNAEKLARAFFIITGGTNAMALATARAEDITNALGLAGGKAREMTKGLSAAIFDLRNRNIAPTSAALEIFAAAFLVTRRSGEKFDDSLQAGISSMRDFEKGVSTTVNDATIGFEELRRRGGIALSGIERDIVDVKGALEAVAEAGFEVDRGITEAYEAVKYNLRAVGNEIQIPFFALMSKLEDKTGQTMADFTTHFGDSAGAFKRAFDFSFGSLEEHVANAKASVIDLNELYGSMDLGEEWAQSAEKAAIWVKDARDHLGEMSELDVPSPLKEWEKDLAKLIAEVKAMERNPIIIPFSYLQHGMDVPPPPTYFGEGQLFDSGTGGGSRGGKVEPKVLYDLGLDLMDNGTKGDINLNLNLKVEVDKNGNVKVGSDSNATKVLDDVGNNYALSYFDVM